MSLFFPKCGRFYLQKPETGTKKFKKIKKKGLTECSFII
ncbi:hypothetical protein B4098_1386 [Heyndrickxia coagulans]|uniref:Uncharacterized protein n=1 Tax=Heyndrickxia coagulans TaxID=1398 RepID=A0A150JXT2_HEYCO|nr:hypothetical protein B4098_1386 [Heyndrickxia coagulans]